MFLTFLPDATFDFEMLPLESPFWTEELLAEYDDSPDELVEEFAQMEKLGALERITTRNTYETKNDSLLAYPDRAQYMLADGELLSGTEY